MSAEDHYRGEPVGQLHPDDMAALRAVVAELDDSAAMHAELYAGEVVPGLTGRMVWDEHTALRTDGEG